jgi:hypothetical protein
MHAATPEGLGILAIARQPVVRIRYFERYALETIYLIEE